MFGLHPVSGTELLKPFTFLVIDCLDIYNKPLSTTLEFMLMR